MVWSKRNYNEPKRFRGADVKPNRFQIAKWYIKNQPSWYVDLATITNQPELLTDAEYSSEHCWISGEKEKKIGCILMLTVVTRALTAAIIKWAEAT
jgi:hypothetical protein